jgi:diguanylate cyclase (GGDEF)-like protein
MMLELATDWLKSLRRGPPQGAARRDLDQHTRRLEALWQIVSVPRSSGITRQLAMLKAGAAALRPGQAFYGQLSYLDGNDVVILDGGSQTAQAAERADDQTRLAKGLRYPLDEGPQADVLAAGGTIGWADIRRVPVIAARQRIREFNGRAAVGTTFLVDGKPHFLMFYSTQPVAGEFTHDDYAYVDVLASFFASQLQQSSEIATQTRFAENTRRLTALWELARAPEVDDRSRLLSMLEAGARALNPGHVFYGQLSYQDGDDIVVIAGSAGAKDDSAPAAEPLLAEGVRFSLQDGIQAEILAASGTIGWADACVPELAGRKRICEFGTRAIIGTKFVVGTRTYFLMFFSFHPAAELFKADDYAYVDVLASFFASQLQRRIVRATEVRLVQSMSRSTALREIAAKSPRLDDHARLLAMLNASASALRPGQEFYGQLSYRDGDEIIILAGTKTDQDDGENTSGRYRLEDGIQGELLASGGTFAWNDACESPELRAHARVRAFGWRAIIGSTFAVAGRTHFLIFGSAQPAAEPFTTDDCAYVDVLASFFASNLHQGTQRNRIREQLEMDKLTGLPNHATFRTAAMQAMASRQAYALAVIDIDGFRHVIETRGHQTADALLVEIGAAIADLAHPGEPVGRIGGGTFAMLLTDVDSESTAVSRTRDLLAALKRPYSIGDRFGRGHVVLGASAGLGYACAGNSYEHLLTKAEAALEAAKLAGPGSLVAFDAKLAAAHTQRRRVHLELEDAINGGQLDVVYQPIVALATMRVCGVEALVRWMHPKHGTILPDAFLPFASENGLSSQIGRFVIGRVTHDLPAYSDGNREAIRTYVNLCAAELADETFIAQLCELFVRDTQLSARLGIEISESVALRDPTPTSTILHKLKVHGVRIAVDNAGTGATSIANLKKLPIDILKISGRLVAGLPGDCDAAAVVEALLSIAATFGYETVAQGVETIEQLTWLKSRGATMAQGIAIARPMGVTPLGEWLMQRRDLPTTA